LPLVLPLAIQSHYLILMLKLGKLPEGQIIGLLRIWRGGLKRCGFGPREFFRRNRTTLVQRLKLADLFYDMYGLFSGRLDFST
jgi:hypothetical protein